jgi:hypothetical protein
VALDIKRPGLILVTLGMQFAGCRAVAPTQSETYGVVTEDESRNFFTYKEFDEARVYRSAEDCGHNAGGLRVLRDNDIKVFNSKAYLDAGLQDEKQKLKFAMQYFTRESSLYAGGTPIIRLVGKDDYKSKFFEHRTLPNGNCNFAGPDGNPNRTAMMFVYGVGSNGYGETLEMIDYNIIKALINFQVTPNTPPPSGDGKIGKLPAYIQFVANKNSPKDGPFGKHDGDAATRIAFNLDLAYRGGVEALDIVTHSNGMVSAQIGYSYFAYHFMRGTEDRNNRCIDRAKSAGITLDPAQACHLQVKPLQLKFYHFQAAPDELWTVGKKSPLPPGFYTDFVPVFEQVSKGSTSALLSYPPNDLNTYFFNLKTHLSWAFRYYYNNGDFLTYPPTSGVGALVFTPVDFFKGRGGFSSVGINESINWIQFGLQLEKLLGPEKFKIGHYYCDEDSESTKKCGKKHSAYYSIMDASHPSKIKKDHWKGWYTP